MLKATLRSILPYKKGEYAFISLQVFGANI